MSRVRCPQCGTEFEKEGRAFCPNPECGYPTAFIEPEKHPEEGPGTARRPGEKTETESDEVPDEPPPEREPEPAPAAATVPEPPPRPVPPAPRRRPKWLVPAAAGTVLLIAIIVGGLAFGLGGSDDPGAGTAATGGNADAGTTSPAPTDPAPTSATAPRLTDDWPGGAGWTVIVKSVPTSQEDAVSAARGALGRLDAAGLDGGVLLTSSYSNLTPGYYAVFSGTFADRAAAEEREAALAEAGFGEDDPGSVDDPYVREVIPATEE